jgi:NitT/TauT family transport system substrate-binding protein
MGARRKMRRGLQKAAVVVAMGALVAGCGGDDEADTSSGGGDGGLPVVKIHGLEGGLGSAALKIIEENGFDEKNGFKLEPFEVTGDASVQFLLQGESDVSFDGDPVTAALLQTQGEDVTTFYPMVVQDAALVVRGDSPYQSVQDLRGKKVGHDGLESGTMTAAQIMLNEFEDIDIEKDLDLQLSPEAALLRLVDRGDLEGVFTSEPATLEAQKAYGMRVVWGPGWEQWEQERGGRAWNISMLARQKWIDANPELAVAVTKAWDDAYAWIKEDPSRLTEGEYGELIGIDDPEVAAGFEEMIATSEYFTTRWTDEDVKAARDFNAFAAELGTSIEDAPEAAVTKLDAGASE